MRAIVILIVALSIPAVGHCQYVRLKSFSEDLQRNALSAVVRVRTETGTGTGFVIAHDTEAGTAFALTAFHVIESVKDIRLQRFYTDHRFPGIDRTYSARVHSVNEESDVALMQFEAGSQRLPTLTIASRIPELPCDGASIGCAHSNPPSVFERRIVEASFVMREFSSITQASSPGIGGQSGGPLLSPTNGHVVGVHLRTSKGKSCFASLTAVHELCDDAGLTACYAPSTSRLRTKTLCVIVIKIALGVALIGWCLSK